MNKIKRKIGEQSSGKILLVSAFIQPILFLFFSLIFTFICYRSKDPTANTSIFSIAALLLAGGIGALCITKLWGENGTRAALFSSLISSALILSISVISYGKLSFAPFMDIICFMLVSLLFIFLGRKKMHNGNKIRKRRKH